MTSKSVVSTLWRVKTSLSPSPKSPPTTPTTRTSVKKLAAIEKCDAEPPSMRSRLPNGVSTASNATEPTTSNDMFDCELRNSDCRFPRGFSLSAHGSLLTVFWLCAPEQLQIFKSLSPELTVRIIFHQ